MKPVEYADRPPAGWFPLDVMRKTSRKWDWVALMIDVDPDDYCNNRGAHRRGRSWGSYSREHMSYEAASDALCDLIETRH